MAFNFFSIRQTPNRYFSNSTAYYPEAVPAGSSGAIDVHGSFRWKNKGSIDEVPSILLTEYKLNTGARLTNLMNLLKEGVDQVGGLKNLTADNALQKLTSATKSTIANVAFGDPYQGLYTGEPTNFHYNLPYLKNGGSIRGEGGGNEWGANRGITDIVADMFPNLSEAVGILGQAITGLKDEGYGAEQIYKFTGSKAKSVTISFPLYNTYSVKEANDNFSFISLFAFQNLRTRTSYYSFLPPKVYSVDTQAEGGIYMPIACVADFKVESIGTLRKMSDFGQGALGVSSTGYRLVPEAYKVTITLRELIPETTNIMQGALGQSKVQVIKSEVVSGFSGFSRSGSAPSSSSGTDGLGLEVQDIADIPLSSTSSNQELADSIQNSNISGYNPNAAADPNDPMQLGGGSSVNISGFDPNASPDSNDPMNLSYNAPAASESQMEETVRSTQENYTVPYSPTKSEMEWSDEEAKFLEGGTNAPLKEQSDQNKIKILEDLTNQQMDAGSEDEWNQIENTKQAVAQQPWQAFVPSELAAAKSPESVSATGTPMPDSVATQLYMRDSYAESLNKDIQTASNDSERNKLIQERDTLMATPLEKFSPENGFKVTEAEYNKAFGSGQVSEADIKALMDVPLSSGPVVRPIDNTTGPVSRETMAQTQLSLMQERANNIMNSAAQVSREMVISARDSELGQQAASSAVSTYNKVIETGTSLREQAASALSNSNFLAMSQIVNATKDAIQPMTDFRGPFKLSESIQTTTTPTSKSTVTETLIYDPVGTKTAFDKDDQEVAAAKKFL